MKNTRLQFVGLLILAALVLGLVLRDVVEQVIIRPAAYFLWMLGVFYRFIPQPVIWLLLILFLVYLTLGNFVGNMRWPRLRNAARRQLRGPLDDLAAQIERKNTGVYFKWQIARTLADIALDLQELRQHTRRRVIDFDEFTASPEVRRYLEAGITTSFSDYAMPGGLPIPESLKSVPPTPFDGDIGPVLDYLESQMENDDDRRRA